MGMDTAMAMASIASSSARLFLLTCLVSSAAWGGDWKFTPSLTLSERYSDNVNLDASGAEKSDWITEITPSISVRRDGARLKVNVDYSLQGLLYADNSQSSTVQQYLNGQAKAELVQEWFFLDATARLGQQPKSLSSAVGVGDAVGIGNSTSIGAYSLSPYMKHRFGSAATVEARITRDGVFISDSSVSDSASTRYLLSAVSSDNSSPLSWSANYNRSDTNNSGTTNSGNERASANARYRLSSKFGLLAQAGMEKNDFNGVSNTVKDFSYYGLGVFYTPSRRFSMDALYNYSDNGNFLSGSATLNPTLRTTINATTSKRAYGRSNGLNITHRTRNSNWGLRYQDDLTTSQQQFLNFLGDVYVYTCPTGLEYLPVGVPPSDPATCTLSNIIKAFNQNQLNQIYVSKNLTGTVSYTLRRNTWTLGLYDNRRQYQGLAGGNDTTQGLQASWSLRPAANTSFTLTGGKSKNETSGSSGLQDDLWNLGLVVTRQFQPKVSGSVEVRHQERQSNQPSGDYAENSVAARLNMSF
jgi:uncharacterized protein (PEP-CTERM system associated)